MNSKCWTLLVVVTALWHGRLYSDGPALQIAPHQLRARMVLREVCLRTMEKLNVSRRPLAHETLIPTMSQSKWNEWASQGISRANIMNIARTPWRFDLPNAAALPQTILPLTDLPYESRRLMKFILNVSRKTLPKNRDEAQREIDRLYRLALQLREADLGTIGENQVREALNGALGGNESEAAAWSIQLKNGTRLVAPHHSRSYIGIEVEHMMRAFNAVLTKHSVSTADLESIEFFHSHPGNSENTLLLSAADESVAVSLRQLLDKAGANRVNFRFSSIARASDGTVWVTQMSPEGNGTASP